MYSELLSLLNFKTSEDVRYSVLSSQGPFEVRFYPRMSLARVTVQGSLGTAFSKGLAFLDEYREGCNLKAEKIEKIGPVFLKQKKSEWEVGFFFWTDLTAATAPRPVNRFIKIEEVPPGRVGVLRFNTKGGEEIFSKRFEELKRWLSRKGLRHSEDFRTVRYEHLLPFSFLRHDEVQVDLF